MYLHLVTTGGEGRGEREVRQGWWQYSERAEGEERTWDRWKWTCTAVECVRDWAGGVEGERMYLVAQLGLGGTSVWLAEKERVIIG